MGNLSLLHHTMKSYPFFLASGRFTLALFLISALHAQTTAPVEQAAGLIRKNDLAAAEALLTPLTQGESMDAAAFFQLGALRLRQQRPDDAVASYEIATKLDPTKAEYFFQYAAALSATMRGASFMAQAMLAPKMKKAFEKSVALDPNHVAALIGLSRYYSNVPEMAGGSLEKAKELAVRVQALNPFLGALELGKIAERGEDFAAALEQFDAASQLQPANAGPHAAAGRMLGKLGRNEEARHRFQRAIDLDPKLDSVRQALESLPR